MRGEDDGPSGNRFEVRPPGDFDLHGLDDETAAPRDLDAELGGFGLDGLHQSDQAPPPLSPSSPSKPTPAAASGASPEIFTLEEADAIPAKTAQTLSLNLEIEGLNDELQKVVGALLGKVLSLPPLRIRIKGDDLG